MKIKEAKKRGLLVYSYSKKRWKYQDNEGVYHLIHKGKEVARGLDVHSFSKKRWEYKSENNVWRLVHKGVEVAKGRYVNSISLKEWECEDCSGFHYSVDLN